MEPQVEQPAQADSASPMDALLDRMVGTEKEEVQQPAESTQGAEQPQEQPQEATETPGDSEDDFEFEGLQLKLPKEAATKLKSAVEGYRDYTRKTQAVAERERMVALQLQGIQLEQSFQQSIGPESQALNELEAAIKQYSNVDWQALDTDSLVKTRHALDMLKERRDTVKQQLEGKRKDFETKLQETRREQLQKATEVIAKAIPKWGPEVQNELLSYGQTEGYSDVELRSIGDPRIIKTLWKAQQWDKLQNGKPLAAKRTQGVPPVVRPGATKPVASPQAQYADTIKQLHQAKDPARKKELVDKTLDLKLSRMLG